MTLTYKKQFNKKFKQPLDKSNSMNKMSKLTGIKPIILNKILKRGEAAYFNNPSSVRPQVKSSRQWGIARIYSAIMNYYYWKKTGKEKGAFKSDRDLFEKHQKKLLK